MKYKKSTLSSAERGWLAGIVDGEGHLGLYKYHYHFKSSYLAKRQFTWRPILTISNTKLELIRRAQEICKGGSIRAMAPSKEGYRTCYRLLLTAGKIRQVTPKIMPYLTAKKDEAILLLKSLELITSYKNDHILHDDTLEKIRLQLRFLRKNGGDLKCQ